MMTATKRIILVLWLVLLGVAHAATAVIHSSENRFWEISEIGYDAPGSTCITYDNISKSSSAYDVAPLHTQTDNERRSAAQRVSFASFGRLLAAKTEAQLGQKLEYVLGNATGNAHNIERSTGMLRQLESVGLHDTPATRQYLTEHLSSVVNNANKALLMHGYLSRQQFSSVLSMVLNRDIPKP